MLELAAGDIRWEDRIHMQFGRVWRRLGKIYGFRYRFLPTP